VARKMGGHNAILPTELMQSTCCAFGITLLPFKGSIVYAGK
jgi:hypothetical protein